MLKDRDDAFGHVLRDFLDGKPVQAIVENDDGLIELERGTASYFALYDQWEEWEKAAMTHVRGRVLDVGCGAGRHAIYLQDQGFEVVGIDNSPLALEVCRARGLRDARPVPLARVVRALGTFDTILMMGNNLALLGNPGRAPRVLRRLHAATSPSGRIVGQTRDPYKTDVPEHLAYHERNRRLGRMPGALRIRIRHRKRKTPWFEYLFVSREELVDLLTGTGWALEQVIDGRSGVYVAVIGKV